jgi:formate dehydrogenase alpha subunit
MSNNNMITITIDGTEVTIDGGKKIYDACIQAGIYLPGLCYDPKLTRFGGCRMCVVDVTSRGRTRTKWACCEPVKEGINVSTNSEEIRKKRKVIMEFLLAAHPLDCPTCNASGDCSLQDAAYFVEQKRGRIPIKRRNEPLLIDNPVIERDYNKCIMCGKCVSICDEIQGNGAIGFQKRGYWTEVGTPFRIPLKCDFCGQCLHVCPVGSFQDHTELYKGHAWEYETTSTICPYCSVGCTVVANVKKGSFVKITSNDLIGVNNGNLCAKGRFGHDFVQAESRLTQPAVYKHSKQEDCTWSEILEITANNIKKTIQDYGPDSVAVIASETMTNEDAFTLQKLFRSIGINNLQTLSNLNNPELNSGIFEKFGALAPLLDYNELSSAGSFFFFGCDASKENPVIANMVRVVMRDKKIPLYIANCRNTEFTPHEEGRILYKYGSETHLLAALMLKLNVFPNSEMVNVENPFGSPGTTPLMNMPTVADISGVSEEEIADMAKGLSGAGKPVIFLGKEIHDHKRSTDIVAAATNLANFLGGRVILYREYCNSQGVNDMGISPTHLPNYKKVQDVDLAPAIDLFEKMKLGKIKTLVVADCDPITHFNDGKFVQDAMSQTEFIVALSSFATSTTKLAKTVFPLAASYERDGSFTNNEGRVQLVRKVIEPIGSSRPIWEIMKDLGSNLGIEMSYNNCEDVANEISQAVEAYRGFSHKNIAFGSQVAKYKAMSDEKHSLNFKIQNVEQTEQIDVKFPITAIIGNSLYHLGVLSRHSKTLNNIEPRVSAELGPDDAKNLELNDGDEVIVKSKQGAIKAVLKVDNRSPVGVVFITKNFEGAPALHLIDRNDSVLKVTIAKS